jgi:type IV fimbrial biogenesis protein FimT
MKTTPGRGLTLIELMIASALLAVLLALAAPDMREAFQRNRLQGAASGLVAGLQLARTEAVRSNRRTVLCRSTDGSACDTTNAAWPGWIVFVDLDADNVRDANEPVLGAGTFTDVSVMPSAAVTALSQRIVFNGDGTARATDNRTLLTGTLAACVATTRPAQNVRDVSLAFGTRTTVRSRDGAGACGTPSDG